METKKILIAETSVEFCDLLSNYLDGGYTLRVCHSGLQARQLLEEFQPNVLVMDLALPELDGISILKHMSQLSHRPRIVLTTCFMSPYVEAAISSYGVDMVMIKPCDVTAMADLIGDLAQMDGIPMVQPACQECNVSKILRNLNIPTKRKGFEYLQRCIDLYEMDPFQSVTKTLYPQVAQIYHTNPVAVERAIRQVIHESWDQRDEAMWRLYFTPCRNGTIPRPTNTEFISQLAEQQKQRKLAQQ